MAKHVEIFESTSKAKQGELKMENDKEFEASMDDRVQFSDGKVKRRYDDQWATQGIIRREAIPRLVESLVSQHEAMRKYIRALEDKIDWILEVNNCCDMPSHLRANCTSDHK